MSDDCPLTHCSHEAIHEGAYMSITAMTHCAEPCAHVGVYARAFFFGLNRIDYLHIMLRPHTCPAPKAHKFFVPFVQAKTGDRRTLLGGQLPEQRKRKTVHSATSDVVSLKC